MFFKKAKTTICAVCGQPIVSKDPRFVDKNRATKVERHTHVECRKA